MGFLFGLDIGGTKIAGAVLRDGEVIAETVVPIPEDYDSFISACCGVISALEEKTGKADAVGICIAGAIDYVAGSVFASNLRITDNKTFRDDIAAASGKKIKLGQDANCMALSEAVDGAGAGYDTVLGLIVGTGVGAGFVRKGEVWNGANGLAGEIGHLPMPGFDKDAISNEKCGCGRIGCMETAINGAALSRLYGKTSGGKNADAKTVSMLAASGDGAALDALDEYYEIFARAMSVVFHSFDPEAIVVGGGLSRLPRLYEEVPKRWGKYALCKNPKTEFLQAKHGAASGVRGAAWLWK